MICTNEFREPVSLCDRVLSETIPLKTICLLGCNQDEMDADFLRKIDVVIPLQTLLHGINFTLESHAG